MPQASRRPRCARAGAACASPRCSWRMAPGSPRGSSRRRSGTGTAPSPNSSGLCCDGRLPRRCMRMPACMQRWRAFSARPARCKPMTDQSFWENLNSNSPSAQPGLLGLGRLGRQVFEEIQRRLPGRDTVDQMRGGPLDQTNKRCTALLENRLHNAQQKPARAPAKTCLYLQI